MHLGTTPTLLSRAPLRPYGLFGTFRYDPDQQQEDGGGTDNKGKKEGADKKDEPAKITLTQEELDAKVQAALAAAQKKADEKAQREREAAERKAAEEQGKWKELADKNAADLKAERDASRRKDQQLALRDHLAEKHPDYVGCAKYIAPLIPGDAEGDDLAKAVKDAAEQYVKDNPRGEKAKGGVPAPLPRTGNRPNQTNPQARSPRSTPNGNRIVSPASRF